MSDRSTLEAQIRRVPGLLRDPNTALSEAFGIDVPPGITVRVIEETPTEAVLALPPPVDPSAPIPESELAGVAGGSSYGCNTDGCASGAGSCTDC
jgi:hypothetical protein